MYPDEFCQAVGTLAEEMYEVQDGEDLCFHLIEKGVIDPAQGEMEAARIVAMHILQA